MDNPERLDKPLEFNSQEILNLTDNLFEVAENERYDRIASVVGFIATDDDLSTQNIQPIDSPYLTDLAQKRVSRFPQRSRKVARSRLPVRTEVDNAAINDSKFYILEGKRKFISSREIDIHGEKGHTYGLETFIVEDCILIAENVLGTQKNIEETRRTSFTYLTNITQQSRGKILQTISQIGVLSIPEKSNWRYQVALIRNNAEKYTLDEGKIGSLLIRFGDLEKHGYIPVRQE